MILINRFKRKKLYICVFIIKLIVTTPNKYNNEITFNYLWN